MFSLYKKDRILLDIIISFLDKSKLKYLNFIEPSLLYISNRQIRIWDKSDWVNIIINLSSLIFVVSVKNNSSENE